MYAIRWQRDETLCEGESHREKLTMKYSVPFSSHYLWEPPTDSHHRNIIATLLATLFHPLVDCLLMDKCLSMCSGLCGGEGHSAYKEQNSPHLWSGAHAEGAMDPIHR